MIEGLFQPVHLLIIATIFLIVFGPGKLAGVGGALGKSVHDFKESMQDDQQETPAVTAHSPATDTAPAAANANLVSDETMRASNL